MDTNKKQLGTLWEEATTLGDAESSPLAIAIIREALGGGDDKTADGESAAERVFRIARDCEDFAEAIVAATIERGGE